MALPQYLSKLNPEQLRAATSVDGYNFVLAGAGSGKTSVLIARIAYMLEQGIQPEHILLITFTNKAAKEMKDRVIRLLGDAGQRVTACTFHSLCANILRKYGQNVGVANDFIVLDTADQETALSAVKEEYFEVCEKRQVEINLEAFPNNHNILNFYSLIVNNGYSFARGINEMPSMRPHAEHLEEILYRFAKFKADQKALDYDDLLMYVERLFKQDIAVREKYDEQFKYIMCDEYQDTNPIQSNILELISRKNQNLMVVGDDNQSIYAFRHADVQNILGFADEHPGCKQFMLTENYRSTQEILDTANAMMEHAIEGIEKRLHGQRHGKRPELIKCNNAAEEAEWIIADICRRKVPLNEIAVIFRSGTQSYILESMLNRYGLAYNKYGGMKFMEKAVVKDLMAFLRTLHNPKDAIALTRILQMVPGIGAKTAKKMANSVAADGLDALVAAPWQKKAFFAALNDFYLALTQMKTLNLSDQLDYLVNDYYYSLRKNSINNSKKSPSAKNEELHKLMDSREDAQALMDMTAGYKSIASFLNDVVLEATHKNEDNVDKLNLTTIHSAKGLQYHTVYLMDCVDGKLPRCAVGHSEEPEELRCVYVAITRAKERLVLMQPEYTESFTSSGERIYNPTQRSRFFRPSNVKQTFDVYAIRR